jgi:hypothetical protein
VVEKILRLARKHPISGNMMADGTSVLNSTHPGENVALSMWMIGNHEPIY